MYKKAPIIKDIVRKLKEGKLLYQAIYESPVRSPATIDNWRKKDPRIDRIINKAMTMSGEKRVGMVEDALFKNAMSGNVTAQIFFLKNQASDRWKDRYDNNTNITGKVGLEEMIKQVAEFDRTKQRLANSTN